VGGPTILFLAVHDADLAGDVIIRGPTDFTPSAVTTIDGQEVVTFLEDVSRTQNLQDPDALYNLVFTELASVSINGEGSSTFVTNGGIKYVGAETTLIFENGTSRTFQNTAGLRQNFTGIDTGEDYYAKFCTPSKTTEEAAASSTAPPEEPLPGEPTATETPAPEPTATGYPYPVIKHSKNVVGGYYLNGTDVAVLSIPSFNTELDADTQEFQAVVQKFLAQAVKDGKKKLVIDLQANGGGSVILGYDLFLQLFPNLRPYGATNLRASEYVDVMGTVASELIGQIDQNNLTALQQIGADDFYNYRASLNENNKPYKSWEDYYGPVKTSVGELTHNSRYRNDWPLHTSMSNGIVLTGFNNRSEGFTQPFLPENIVMVTDGYCASTCAVFSEFMKQQAGVQSIALGGRPQYGPMQAVGGVKG
jgi:hypothetical protein